MKALFVGGGTGGHIYPAIAIAQAVQDKIIDSQILFVGSEEGIETRIVPKERFSLVTIKSRGMLRKLTYRSISSPFYALAGFFQSIGILRSFKPDIVIATGGFVSFPVVVAAFILKIPVILHEGNVTPGLTIRLCKWFASCITISFEASRKYFRWRKVYCLGGPVRKEIIKTVQGIAKQNMGIRQDQKTLLVLGGSQGAKSINKIIIDSLGELENMNAQIIHVCGDRDYSWIREAVGDKYSFYHLIPYMFNIWDGLAASDLVISRAGATAISEIIARGLPSILIPFPFSAGRHQDYNARLLENAGASIILNDNNLSKESLLKAINDILTDKDKYLKMREASISLSKKDASFEFVHLITNMLGIDLYARKRKKTNRKK
jgi:UDP-N-acetylglucosamine--N-acetylmuramyl-(pentapeptide) pyrophosphoryl-undecaprenol N-acetylglucosamine transferase